VRGLTAVALGFALVLSGWIYLRQLDRTPVYLTLDEAHFGVHAHAIATTARDLNGDVLPLFVNLGDPAGDRPQLAWGNTWYQPILFYVIALALQVLPLSEAAIRTPAAFAGGVVNVALVFAVADRLFARRRVAIAAAAMFALCPANLLISRQAVDYTAPIFFVLAWLWCLASYIRDPRRRYAAGVGLVLGAGCYSYITSWLMMPAYLLLSWLVMSRAGGHPRRAVVASIVTFGLPMLALLPWLWLHPEMPRNLLAQYSLPDSEHVSAFQALRQGVGTIEILRNVLSTYWSYFDPSFLFVSGGASRRFSTGLVGVFLLPIAVLLPIGLYSLVRRDRRSWVSLVLIVGLLSAPLAATLRGAPFAIERTMALLPFVVLISASGLALLWESRHMSAHLVAALLFVAQPVQFLSFYRDYLSGYRIRSAFSYDATAFAEAAPFLVESALGAGQPTIYLTTPLADVSAKWRFWTTRLGHQELLARTRYFDGTLARVRDAAAGSIAVIPADDAAVDAWVASGEWTLLRRVISVDGQPALAILRRTDLRTATGAD
jgi:hypothetical protein